ncbi:MAG: hypothetical protein GY835_17750 [bacterium]|nr:hypothetical protein [bacterium]
MKKVLLTCLCAIMVMALGSSTLLAQPEYDLFIHYEGFGYEEGGFDYSAPGDEIHLITRITGITADPVENMPDDFPYYPDVNEYTLVVTGLSSNGEIDYGPYSTIAYSGGIFAIYEDTATPSDWNEYPSIATPPPSFMDGNLWLTGPFSEFSMTLYRDQGMASYSGILAFDGGSALDFFEAEAYTFGGALWPPHSPGLPPGYDISLDGEVYTGFTATQTTTISQLKALY